NGCNNLGGLFGLLGGALDGAEKLRGTSCGELRETGILSLDESLDGLDDRAGSSVLDGGLHDGLGGEVALSFLLDGDNDGLVVLGEGHSDSLVVDESIVAGAVDTLEVKRLGGESLLDSTLTAEERRVVADDLPGDVVGHFTWNKQD
ncbi:hypothetical protein PENTCL1PPCAC_27850, partial [Pristionchus entomophagus]